MRLIPKKCPVTQYIANKPDKFGIKFWIAADNDSKYFLNEYPYIGADLTRPANIPSSEYVVLRVAEPFLGKERNTTCDYFTSCNLAVLLKERKTTPVGTLNKRRGLPKIASQKNQVCVDSNQYFTALLVLY